MDYLVRQWDLSECADKCTIDLVGGQTCENRDALKAQIENEIEQYMVIVENERAAKQQALQDRYAECISVGGRELVDQSDFR